MWTSKIRRLSRDTRCLCPTLGKGDGDDNLTQIILRWSAMREYFSKKNLNNGSTTGEGGESGDNDTPRTLIQTRSFLLQRQHKKKGYFSHTTPPSYLLFTSSIHQGMKHIAHDIRSSRGGKNVTGRLYTVQSFASPEERREFLLAEKQRLECEERKVERTIGKEQIERLGERLCSFPVQRRQENRDKFLDALEQERQQGRKADPAQQEKCVTRLSQIPASKKSSKFEEPLIKQRPLRPISAARLDSLNQNAYYGPLQRVSQMSASLESKYNPALAQKRVALPKGELTAAFTRLHAQQKIRKEQRTANTLAVVEAQSAKCAQMSDADLKESAMRLHSKG